MSHDKNKGDNSKQKSFRIYLTNSSMLEVAPQHS